MISYQKKNDFSTTKIAAAVATAATTRTAAVKGLLRNWRRCLSSSGPHWVVMYSVHLPVNLCETQLQEPQHHGVDKDVHLGDVKF